MYMCSVINEDFYVGISVDKNGTNKVVISEFSDDASPSDDFETKNSGLVVYLSSFEKLEKHFKDVQTFIEEHTVKTVKRKRDDEKEDKDGSEEPREKMAKNAAGKENKEVQTVKSKVAKPKLKIPIRRKIICDEV